PGGIRGKITFVETTPASTPPSPVVGCTIEVTDEAGARKIVKTDAAGSYRWKAPAGRYRIVFADCKRGMGIGGCQRIVDASVPVEVGLIHSRGQVGYVAVTAFGTGDVVPVWL